MTPRFSRLTCLSLAACLLAVCGAGCASTPLVARFTLPDHFTTAQQQLMVHSDFPLPVHHRLLEDLAILRADLLRQLALPASDEPIHVYLFDTGERFDSFMRVHYPDFPSRRAFFVETDTRLTIYAQWGDRMAEDLRHETTHGYLHSVIRNLPLWIDEGLAEYAEPPRGQRGVNRPNLERLLDRIRRGVWQPNLKRFEDMPPTQEMTQDDYTEAWAWIHFLLESQPQRADILRAYLAELKRDGTAEPISARLSRLGEPPERALIEHVTAMGASQRML